MNTKKEKRARKMLENIPEARGLTERQKLATWEVASRKLNVIWVCILFGIFAISLIFVKLGIVVNLQNNISLLIAFGAIILLIVGLVRLRTYLIRKVIKDKEYEVYLAKQDDKMKR